MENKERCGAKTRSGNPCRKYPVKGAKRCKLHGGATPRGNKSPHFKHGIYSKYASESLKNILNHLRDQSSEDLIDPQNEILLMQGLILSANALKNDLSDLKDLDTLSKVIERLVMAKQRSQKIMLEQQRLIPAGDIEQFLTWMEELLIGHIGDEQAFTIMDQLKNFKLSDHAIN